MMNSTNSRWARLIPTYWYEKLKKKGELRRVISNAGWLMLDTIIQIVTNLIVGIWLSRYLGPEQRGIIYYADAFVGLFVPISALGLGEILIRELVRFPGLKHDLLGTSFIIQTLSYFLFLPFIILSVWFMRKGETMVQLSVIIIAIGSIFLNSRIFNWWFASQLQSKYMVWATRFVEITIATVKVVFLLFEAPLLAFVSLTAIKFVLYFGVKYYYYWKVGERIQTWRFNRARVVPLLRESWPLAFAFVSISIYSKINGIMLGQMLGDSAAGIFGEADRLSSLWYFIPGAIASSMYPVLVQTRETASQTKYTQIVQIFLDVLVLISYSIIIPVFIFSPVVITVLYGAAFTESGEVLMVLIWALIFISLKQGMDYWLMVEKRTKYTVICTILGIGINIILNLWLIPIYGVKGVGWSTVFALAGATYLTALMIPTIRPLFKHLLIALVSPLRIYTIILNIKKII